MKYHAVAEYSGRKTRWWNYSKDSMIEKVVSPFVNGQVILGNDRNNGGQRLLNMRNVTFLKVYCTKNILKATDEKSVSQQIDEESFQSNDCTAVLLSEVQSENSINMPTSSLIQKAFLPSKNQIFVVMKFGDEVLDSAYEGAYKAIAKEFDLDCVRVDEVHDSGKISDQILNGIAESKYVIADLTGARPNCYYETGFAHALGKELILVIKDGEGVHFDLAGHRFINWRTENDLRNKIRERIGALEETKSRA